MLTLREMLDAFLEHRKEIVFRRTEFELRKAEERAHILEGLKIALDNLDEVIDTIRAGRPIRRPRASNCVSSFKLSDVQAQAILEMRLQRLTGLERQKILDELKETLELIASLKEILGDEEMVMEDHRRRAARR